MFYILTVVNILPVGSLGLSFLDGDVGAPLLDLVDDPLVDDGFKFPSKEDLPASAGLDLCPVFRKKIIWAAATPVNNVLVLTLAPLFPFPVCQMEVVVNVRLTEGRVTQNCVEK